MPRGIYNHRPLSEETKKKIGLKSRGRKMSPDALKKMSEWQKGIYKTDNPSYNTLHWRVRQRYGKANMCSNEDCPGKCDSYDWANVSGKYLNEEDFVQLCRTCHIEFDSQSGSKFGRPKSNGNT